jgi:hypothetical protein
MLRFFNFSKGQLTARVVGKKMMIRLAMLAPWWVIFFAVAGSLPDAHAQSPVERSRALTAEFGQRLQTELKAAMSQGGPVAAVKVCRDRAPQISSELSRMSGARVARTSLRYRNPANAPDYWEAGVLAEFEQRDAAGDSGALEASWGAAPGRFRYMSAIRTQPVCLTCHGTSLAPETAAALEQAYPHDLATGYTLGEVRGAFSVTWPAGQSEPQELEEQAQ